MSRLTLAAFAVPAALLLPVTVPGVADAAPTAAVAARPAPSTVAHRRHLSHLHHLHVLHVRVIAARKAATSARAKLLRVAASYRGVPYVYGGASRSGVDCSGYVDRVYVEAIRKKLPRTVSGLRHVARITKRPAVGDIVFYTGGAHVALVAAVRNGKVTNTWVARHTGTRVQTQKPYTSFVVGAVI